MSLIYRAYDENGNMYYAYTYGVWGGAHHVEPDKAEYMVPKDAKVVSVIHSHPNSQKFSNRDRDYAKNNKYSIYLVARNGEGAKIRKYTLTQDNEYDESTIRSNVPTLKLSAKRKNELEDKFANLWYMHTYMGCADNFECENMKWPRE